MTTLSLKPSLVAQALEVCIEQNQPVILWGTYGIGKSDIVRQLAQRLGYQLKDDRAVLKDPVDLRGLPHVNGDGLAHFAPPADFPRDGKGIWFMDELNRAPVLVQNAYFQLVLDRQLGEYTLPPEWRIIAACNRESDGAGLVRMPQGLLNRFLHIDVEPDLEDFCSWATTGGLPAEVAPLMVAFMRWRPNLLHQFNRDEHAFPTPRSWEFVSRVVNKGAPQEIELALIAGAVGHGAATEFMGYLRLFRNLPSLDVIFTDPDSAPVPNDVGTLYAIASALAMRVTDKNIGNVLKYLNRIQPEYAAFCVRDAALRDPSLQTTPEFIKWMISHAGVLG